MPDPRERRAKRLYMKVFGDDAELYKRFLELYDEAVADGSTEPEDKAMIMFRDEHEETEEGWRAK